VHTIVEHNFLLRKNISNLRHYDTAVSQDLLHALSRMQADREIYRGTHTHIYMYIYMENTEHVAGVLWKGIEFLNI